MPVMAMDLEDTDITARGLLMLSLLLMLMPMPTMDTDMEDTMEDTEDTEDTEGTDIMARGLLMLSLLLMLMLMPTMATTAMPVPMPMAMLPIAMDTEPTDTWADSTSHDSFKIKTRKPASIHSVTS